MTTSVYGNRDFKGNQLLNPAMHPVANMAALNALTIHNPGQQAWVSDEKQPYWWDGTAWKTIGGGGSYYGVKSDFVNPTMPTPDYTVGQTVNEVSTTILTPGDLAIYPEISEAHPLVVELTVQCGFTVRDVDPADEVYNRLGIAKAVVRLEAAPGATIDPYTSTYGYYQHGYTNPLGTSTLSGILSPLGSTVANVPVFYGATENMGLDMVDQHILPYYENYFSMGVIDVSLPVIEIFKWSFSYGTSSGLVMNVETTIPGVNVGYNTVAGPDWIGFFGGAVGWRTLYWF